MGSACCREDENQINHYSKKIMQGINSKVNEKSKDMLMINIFDIESEVSIKTQPTFILSNFEGLGQLNLNNNLYFCGGNEKKKGGTYFFVYDPLKYISQFSLLLNCSQDHKYPAMISYKNEFILVVGGHDSNLKCEIYSFQKKKWKPLPDLPEARVDCSLLNEEKLEYIYLFGGITNDNEFCSSILRLNIKNQLVWESVVVKEGSNLLQRSSFGIMKLERNILFLLGGTQKNKNETDQIIEFDLFNKSAKESTISLQKPAKFLISNYSDLNNQNFFFVDSNSFIHVFNKFEMKFKYINNLDLNNDSDNIY